MEDKGVPLQKEMNFFSRMMSLGEKFGRKKISEPSSECIKICKLQDEISFTNKAVGELREKINKDLQIDCPIATFHSTGNAILKINDPQPLNIFEGSKLYFLLQNYFKQSILTNEALVNNLIRFFAS